MDPKVIVNAALLFWPVAIVATLFGDTLLNNLRLVRLARSERARRRHEEALRITFAAFDQQLSARQEAAQRDAGASDSCDPSPPSEAPPSGAEKQIAYHEGDTTMKNEDEACTGKGADMPVTEGDLHQLMRTKFPGMEHYFVSPCYTFKKNSPHKDHGGFIYCGFVDSLGAPHQARCFRSVTLGGLNRLLQAEDPGYIPDIDKVPLIKNRMRFPRSE